MTPEEVKKQKRKEANKKYNQSQKGKEAKARARETDSYKEAQKKYMAKPEVREKKYAKIKAYRQTDKYKKKNREYAKKFREENPDYNKTESAKASKKKRADNNKEYIKEYYNKKNTSPDSNFKLRADRRIRFIKQKYPEAVTDNPPLKEDFLIIMKRQNNKCNLCKAKLKNKYTYAYEIDHILPFFQWGKHEVDNIQFLCEACHHTKSKIEVSQYQLSLKKNQVLLRLKSQW